MPRINQLPTASSVAQTDVLAIDTPEKTYQVPRSVLAPAPFKATIQPGYWSGSGSDYYFTVSASNVTANAQLYPFYDKASDDLLNGPVWCVPAAGSFTIHTSAIPSGTVTISVLLAGIVGEAQYQVLADVYSKSQVDSIVQQSTADAQRVNLRETMNGNLLSVMKTLQPGIWHWKNSSSPTGAPDGANFGSYTIIVSEDKVATIFFAQRSVGIVAVANGIDINTATSISWTVLQSTASANLAVREYNHQYSIPALGNVFWNPYSDSIALSGYSTLGVVGFATNTESVLPINVTLNGGNYGIGLHNRASATATGTFSYRVLYVKNA